MAGRKPPLYIGLTLFILGSIECAFSPGSTGSNSPTSRSRLI
jgi:hypothetical protein